MNNVESLKNLAVKLGVEPIESELISEQIQNIADNYEGGSGGAVIYLW